jgi:hypothetical protein
MKFVRLSDFHSGIIENQNSRIRKSLEIRHSILWHVYCLFKYSNSTLKGEDILNSNISKKK